jgi:hypothetical protein
VEVRWKQGCCVSASSLNPGGLGFESQSNLSEICHVFPQFRQHSTLEEFTNSSFALLYFQFTISSQSTINNTYSSYNVVK